ncbi:hypothetical protein DRQ36_03045 [bacterium]|nr:MAG: hypothetical protein DRQ36_03045 [bacterium]
MEYEARVLIVDDELPVCKSISSALEGEECCVDIALSGEEALQKDEEKGYDVIITDLMMPGISGMDLLKTMRKRCPETIVIIVTGYPSIKTAVQSTKLGAFDYLPKPFTPAELRSLVSRALAKRRVDIEEKKEKPAETPIPKGTYCIPENSWVKEENDGNARVGIHHAFFKTIGDIRSIEFPEVGEMRYQGEAYLRISDANKRTHRLWTPVTGKIISVNEDVKADYSKLAEDPYGEGWLILMEPTHLQDDLKNLVSME